VVAIAEVRESLLPRICGLREEIAVLKDLAAAQELVRRIEAFRRYVSDRETRDLLAAESRRTETLIGQLLGPGEVGQPGQRAISRMSEVAIPREDRHRFRLLAEHAAEVEALLQQRVVARRAILEKIQCNGRRAERPAKPVVGAFTTITADPPWQYENRATRAAAQGHYATLAVNQVCELEVDGRPVRELAAPQSHLYLWTTNGFLRDAFLVLESWGFTYKTLLTWVKPQLGIGNYFRSSTEHVLFGVRGEMRTLNSNQRNWFEARRGRHSRKPDCFYDIVERASPGPYLELFGRPDPLLPRPGWTFWGHEA
jgi:N6-adenosine-specific RNA methylase IME4